MAISTELSDFYPITCSLIVSWKIEFYSQILDEKRTKYLRGLWHVIGKYELEIANISITITSDNGFLVLNC